MEKHSTLKMVYGATEYGSIILKDLIPTLQHTCAVSKIPIYHLVHYIWDHIAY